MELRYIFGLCVETELVSNVGLYVGSGIYKNVVRVLALQVVL